MRNLQECVIRKEDRAHGEGAPKSGTQQVHRGLLGLGEEIGKKGQKPCLSIPLLFVTGLSLSAVRGTYLLQWLCLDAKINSLRLFILSELVKCKKKISK